MASPAEARSGSGERLENPFQDDRHPAPDSRLRVGADSSLELVASGSRKAPPAGAPPGYNSDDPSHYGQHIEKSALLASQRSSRRRLFLFGTVFICIAVVVGAVVGGIFGSRAILNSANDGHNEDSPPPTPSISIVEVPLTTTASGLVPTPTSIAAASHLAVAPRYGDDEKKYFYYLAFKSPAGQIYYVVTDSLANSMGANATSMPLRLEASDTAKDSGVWMVSQEKKINVLFFNADRGIDGLVYDDREGPEATAFSQSDDLKKAKNITAAADSDMAAYGPWRIYQDNDGKLQVIKEMESCEDWKVSIMAFKTLPVTAKRGSKLAIVPLTNNGLDLARGIMAIFYQREDGVLAALAGDEVLIESEKNYVPTIPKGSWASNALPDTVLPKGNSFAVFATTRFEDESIPIVNIYLLYQDEDNDIKELRMEDGATWQTSSPYALKGADAGTSITCIALSAWSCKFAAPSEISGSSSHFGHVPDSKRCYFWKDGLVVEVMREKNGWVELGPVTLP